MLNKITITEKACLKHKLSMSEALLALAFKHMKDTDIHNMLNREIIVRKNGKYMLTQHWNEELDDILADSSGKVDKTAEELLVLAKKMRAIYPKCKMKDRFGRDTAYYFSCNNTEVVKKLKKFFENEGNYSDEEILEATERYVKFHAQRNYRGMRLIKYFIWKDDVKPGEDGNGHVEPVSDLATYLSNKEEESEGVVINSDDWMLNTRN